MNELDTALCVASGELPSPTKLRNSDFVALRLSGTGVAYRASIKEYVFRDPNIWLTDEMRRRFLGLPVIVEHPPSGEMTSKDFGDSAVGLVVVTFVRDEELWGVARIVDSSAAKFIAEGVFDTSPAVAFSGSVLPNGEVILPDHEIARRKRFAAFARMSPVERHAWAREYVAASNREQWASLRKVCEPRLISPHGFHLDAASCAAVWDECSDPRTVPIVLHHVHSVMAWLVNEKSEQLEAGEPVLSDVVLANIVLAWQGVAHVDEATPDTRVSRSRALH
jgi:hypothetical protein